MNNDIWKKAAAFVVACGLCVSTGFLGFTAYAKSGNLNGRTKGNTVSVYKQGDGSYAISSTENFFGNYTYSDAATEIYLPGDTIDNGWITINNNSGESDVSLYLYALPTEQTRYSTFLGKNSGLTEYSGKVSDFKAKSESLVDELTLNVTYSKLAADGVTKTGTETTVYNGTMGGKQGTKSGNKGKMLGSSSTPNNLSSQAILLGTYASGEKGVLSFNLTIPKEIGGTITTDSSGNVTSMTGYNGGVAAMIDWVFIAKKTDPPQTPVTPSTPTPVTPSTPTPTPVTPSSPTPSTPTVPIPKTGEEAIPYAVAAVACALGAFGIFKLGFGKRSEENV